MTDQWGRNTVSGSIYVAVCNVHTGMPSRDERNKKNRIRLNEHTSSNWISLRLGECLDWYL
jgi:hypothetical protein